MDEIWKNIAEFEGIYQISTHGRVRRFWPNAILGYKILNPWTDRKTGYQRVDLCTNGHKDVRRIHQLVLETFVGLRGQLMEGRHLNGKRQDNRLENLKWGTKSENQQDRVLHGTTNRGRGNAKLTSVQVSEIRQLLMSSKYTHRSIAAMFGVCESTITDINIGRRWRGVK